MAPVKLKYIVSFTSQDDNHKANNLITGGGMKKWLCHPKDRNGKIEIIIQLEEATQFSFIDIGTMWCASLEIRVGNSDWPQTTEYETLVPMINLMSPVDCQLGRKTTNTQMFTSKDFSNTVIGKKWDRIQLIGRQPYRKDMQLGISFIRIRSSGSSSLKDLDSAQKKSPQMKNLSDIKKHFFGNSKQDKEFDEDQLKQRLLQISSSSDNGCDNLHEESLSRTAQLVLKASEKTNKSNAHYTVTSSQCKRGLFSDTKTNKTGLTLEEEMAAFLPTLDLSLVDFDIVTVADLRHKFERKKRRKLSPQERRKFSEQCQAFMWKLSESVTPENQSSSTNGNMLSPPSPRNMKINSTQLNSSVSSSNRTNGENDPNKHSSIHPAFSSPSSIKASSNPTAKSESTVKMSPAAIMRKKNHTLENRLTQIGGSKDLSHCSKSNKSVSKENSSSSESNKNDLSDSDICYNSSDDDRDSIIIDDSSPNHKTHIKRKLQTLDDVNRSYQDLYKTFIPENIENDSVSNYSSVKRKKLNNQSKKLMKSFESELGDDEEQKNGNGDPTASNSKMWLSASKNAQVVALKSARSSKTDKPGAKKTSNTPNTKKKACVQGVVEPESHKVFRWPSKNNAIQKNASSHQAELLERLLQADKYFSSTVTTGSSSILCKSCGFLIPEDTYAAHRSACTSPTIAHPKGKVVNKSTSSTFQNGGNNADSQSDVIDLTESSFPQCPICLQQFPQEILMVHASECGL